MPDVQPVPREVIGAFTGWVNNSGGPTHTQLDEAILNAGLDVPEGVPNKPSKVRAAFDEAKPAEQRKLVEELVHVIRDGGYWRHGPYERNVAATKAAIALIGGTITDDGFLTWDCSAGDAVLAGVTAGGAPVHTPITTLTASAAGFALDPAPPLAQSGHPNLPSNDFLLWLLRRVPASFNALVGRRRSGHDSLVLVDEYDLQDATETALRLLYDDVRPEERTPSYAGSSTTQDFLLKDVKTMVEIKVTRPGRGNRVIRDEITIDTESYTRHPDVERMVFVIYDIAATIQNPAGFERDLSTSLNGRKRDVLVVPWPYPTT